jgi:DNA-binding MarR family transcriptional regulator
MRYVLWMAPAPPVHRLTLDAALERAITSLWRALNREVPPGLSRTAASVLATLRSDGPRWVTTLAEHEQVAQPSMSVLLQRLERRGLVLRSEDPSDRRACRVAITPEGEEVLRRRAEARAAWLRARLVGLSEEERRTVARTLELLENLPNDPQEDVHER